MNTTYLDMIMGKPVHHIPVWFMRQAGRSQAEYRKIKEKYGLFEITHQPELCAYITQLPVEKYNVDAAILYKDIMTPLEGMGIKVDIKSGVGPVIEDCIKSEHDVAKLGNLCVEEDLPYVVKTIEILTKERLNVPLIGFCGAPYTLACYLIEGKPTCKHSKTKDMMLSKPRLWNTLMEKLTEICTIYLKGQIKAGVQALQIFDSWSGDVNKQQYLDCIYPYMLSLLTTIKKEFPHIPITIQAVGASHLLPLWKSLPADVISLDWRISIKEAHNLHLNQALQGNLDPSYLQADWNVLERELNHILEEGISHGRYIFNLGHGVLPNTNPDVLKRVAEYVHSYEERYRFMDFMINEVRVCTT